MATIIYDNIDEFKTDLYRISEEFDDWTTYEFLDVYELWNKCFNKIKKGVKTDLIDSLVRDIETGTILHLLDIRDKAFLVHDDTAFIYLPKCGDYNDLYTVADEFILPDFEAIKMGKI